MKKLISPEIIPTLFRLMLNANGPTAVRERMVRTSTMRQDVLGPGLIPRAPAPTNWSLGGSRVSAQAPQLTGTSTRSHVESFRSKAPPPAKVARGGSGRGRASWVGSPRTHAIANAITATCSHRLRRRNDTSRSMRRSGVHLRTHRLV